MSKLKDRRQAAGLTQRQLSSRVPGVSIRTLQYYEQGSLDINKAAALTVWRIAAALGCQVEDLLEVEPDELLPHMEA